MYLNLYIVENDAKSRKIFRDLMNKKIETLLERKMNGHKITSIYNHNNIIKQSKSFTPTIL